jgi:hypothetical protein
MPRPWSATETVTVTVTVLWSSANSRVACVAWACRATLASASRDRHQVVDEIAVLLDQVERSGDLDSRFESEAG